MFDIDRIVLDQSHKYILARLLANEAVFNDDKSAEELYALLPEDVRDMTTLIEFIDFLDSWDTRASLRTISFGSIELTKGAFA
jgi:hypothetical protein